MSKSTDTDNKSNSLYSMMDTDKEREKAGIWVDFGPVKIQIKRAGGSNKEFQKLLRANLKPYKYQIDKGLMEEDDPRYQECFMDAFVRGVVINWEDADGKPEIEFGDGSMKAFSPENAKKLFKDLEEVFAEVLSQSTRVANFRRQEVDDTAKKSLTS